ncbi:Integrin alpha-IIb [Echinococcus granulosus]|uniref:Integrin alpha 3 n=1 Tax=Echinococcus granulosus TaxID=6210 RepID=A0A068WQM6_ECHGR|nr:Integrin alpha-IIb [Echinococcus granulosus]CDS19965.1 integrin alpha 3 [Echinococcus granulosus]
MQQLHLALPFHVHLFLFFLSAFLPPLITLAVDIGPKCNNDWLFPSLGARIYSTEKRGTNFGYSVASYVAQSQAFCLVGAPKARNTYDFLSPDPADTLRQQDTLTSMFGNTTGLIYRLNLDMEYPDCSRMPIADNNEDRRLFGALEPGISLWIGGLVAAASNGGDGLQLGCDPRYLYTPSALSPSSKTSSTSASLPGLEVQNLGTGTCALYTGVSMQYTPIDACVSAEEGACLSGFSGVLESGDEPGEAYAVLGMPGSYLTEGNVFFGHYQGQRVLKQLRLKSTPQDLKHKGFNLGYAVGLYKHPQWENQESSPSHSRFTILASSPMWADNDYRGVVMLLTEALNLDSIQYISDKWGHIGSFFGYSIAAADLNGDEIPEIIVGSPYFSENQRFTKSQEGAETSPDMQADQPKHSDEGDDPESRYRPIIADVGRVYVFYGKSPEGIKGAGYIESESDPGQRGRGEYMHEPPVILKGPRRSGGRFGHVVLSMGDLDGDGTEDLAISCPFCQDIRKSVDRGAVYVYLGRKNAKIKDEPDQVIHPADLPTKGVFACENAIDDTSPLKRPFSAFGWSMASKSDVDGNMSPDLVVGDYESEQIVTLRSRNLVWLEQPLWRLPEGPTLDWSSPHNDPCESSRCHYRVALNLSLHARETLFSSKRSVSLLFRYRIDLDSRIKQENGKRLESVQLGKSIVEDTAEIQLSSLKGYSVGFRRFQLFEMTVGPRWHQTVQQLWKPVVINVTIEMLSEHMDFVATKGAQIPAWSLHPLKGDRIFLSQPMYFSNPDCGYDDICVPDLNVEVYDTSEGFEFGGEGPSTIHYKERVTERNFTVAVRNQGENAYDTKVRVHIPAHFAYTPDKNYACKIESEPIEMEEEDVVGKSDDDITVDGDDAGMEVNKSRIPITTVVCSLTNPFITTYSQWEKIRFQLGTLGAFQPPPGGARTRSLEALNGSQTSGNANDAGVITPVWQPPRRLEIVAEVTSDNENMRNRKVVAKFAYDLKLFADIKLSSSSVGHTVFDRRNFSSQFTERQRVHPESIGPEFEQIFLVSNLGPSPMENIWVNLSVPLQTEAGDFLVYLLDLIRTQNTGGGPPLQIPVTPDVVSADGQLRGTCYTPESAINPLRLTAVDRKRSGGSSRRNTETDIETAYESAPPVREARSAASADLLSERIQQQKIVSCDHPLESLGSPICLHIPCKIDRLGRGDAVRIVFRGWVWADTLFRHKFSDVAIVITATAQIPLYAFGIPVTGNFTITGLTVSQNFVFEGIKMIITQTIPILPVIVGVVLGILLLIIIIIIMWRCGFFKRKRLTDEAAASGAMAKGENGHKPV